MTPTAQIALDGAAAPAAPASPPAFAIVARDVRKSYAVGSRQVEILHGVSLQVAEGEMVAVMGPSGSGKSTLLYCLAGLETPTSGTVAVAGRNLASVSRADLARLRRSELGFVFQSYNLIPTLTARQNVELPYTLNRRSSPAGIVERTLATVGLTDRADARPPSMSGGEQQRVALARVLAQEPRVVFADEPTGALDTRTGKMVLDELVSVAHSPGRCALVVTHDPAVAAACDRVLFMRDGRLVQDLRGSSVDRVASTLAALSGHEGE